MCQYKFGNTENRKCICQQFLEIKKTENAYASLNFEIEKIESAYVSINLEIKEVHMCQHKFGNE